MRFAADVHAVAVAARGSRYAVRAEEHLLTRVLSGLGGFGECAGYGVDTGTPFYFSHSRWVLEG